MYVFNLAYHIVVWMMSSVSNAVIPARKKASSILAPPTTTTSMDAAAANTFTSIDSNNSSNFIAGGEKLTLKVDLCVLTPVDLIRLVINKRIRKLSAATTLKDNRSASLELPDAAAQACCDNYLLKVAGFQLYLLKQVPLIQYKVCLLDIN